MAGPVLCALPSVTHQSACQSFSGPSHSRILNADFRPSSLSLPPLTRYPEPTLKPRRWGEDNDLVNPGFCDPASSERNNFNCCHSVPDVLSRKYEGYMYPKSLCQDTSTFRHAPFNTRRYGQRAISSSRLELFPTHNQHRPANNGNCYALPDATRQALTEYISRLYGTSRYDLTYRDTSEFMCRKADRDKQYIEVTGDFQEAPTCCRVLNHPDPCPYCWIGSMNKPLNGANATQSAPNQKPECTSRDKCCDAPYNGGDCCPKPDQGSCSKNTECKSNDGKHANEQDNTKTANITEPNSKGDAADALGPWTGYPAVDEGCEPLLLSNVYNFKLPSSHHNARTENEYVSSYLERHGLHHLAVSVGEPETEQSHSTPGNQCRGKDGGCMLGKLLEKRQTIQNGGVAKEEAMLPALIEKQQLQKEEINFQRNSWTNREERHNLRMPCISKVIGCMNKTAAHNRIHADNTAPVPDLRDFRRYSKRVFFNGYNSAVFQ